ncbi:helix-turn-helix domain-containing protein [Chitinophaga sp. SYP-B3965]|uniref:GlxA family transcriptional regulator n=1 Tax=Chitinophaga sp. SYP-B3965 TaxID=2663120 RepID=UPI0012998681|nr:helix-turn-helix domain-containing protein [Chitinophaga sp. SYP-B3965]MRG45815.1 helix-turn-helix domain-containing protein [Chitinophaga sp. SYP-B3965]
MKHITILVPNEAVLASVDDPRYIFTEVNKLLEATGKQAAFDVSLVGLTKEVLLHDKSYTVHTDLLLKDVKKTDLVFIPALTGDIKKAIAMNREFIPWINQQYKNGAEIASLCVGAFLLAATGLLKGRKCSTHWGRANEFRHMFPDVKLVDDKIMMEDQGLYSSGGANSYLNLLLHFIEKYTDRETAILTAKVFEIEIDRKSQATFSMFMGQRDHDDESIKKAQAFIENNYQYKITVDQLAGMFSLGRRSLERRFKKATSITVIEYMQRVKIESAKKSFENSRKNILEVMNDVGYADTKAFRVIFKKITGLSPIDYRNKYNKEAMAM